MIITGRGREGEVHLALPLYFFTLISLLPTLAQKDCKSGGYNLEDSNASVERLTSLVLLIALAYTCAGLRGQTIKASGQQKYIGRLQELKRMTRRHSNFWVGLYGQMWIAALESCSDWVRNLMMIRPNKRRFFQKGLRAMALIQANF